MTTNIDPQECVIFVQSTKIGTHENKAIHSSLERNYKQLQPGGKMSLLFIQMQIYTINILNIFYI